MNVSSLTPWLSDFHTVWFSGSSGGFLFLNLLLSFWLCKEAKCIYLCLHLGRKSVCFSICLLLFSNKKRKYVWGNSTQNTKLQRKIIPQSRKYLQYIRKDFYPEYFISEISTDQKEMGRKKILKQPSIKMSQR